MCQQTQMPLEKKCSSDVTARFKKMMVRVQNAPPNTHDPRNELQFGGTCSVQEKNGGSRMQNVSTISYLLQIGCSSEEIARCKKRMVLGYRMLQTPRISSETDCSSEEIARFGSRMQNATQNT